MTIPTSGPAHRGSRIFARLDHPYYVCAPKFRQTSGGVRAMHYLCHVLNLLGHEAYVNTDGVHPDLRTPHLTNDVAQAHADAHRSPIAVYPEIVSGNPFGTRCVARYLLAEPGRIEGNAIDLQPSDLVFTFGPTLVPAGWQADELRMPLVDTRIFNSDGVDDARRSGTAVFINRHLVRGGSLHPVTADSIEISNRVPERSAHELAALFRQVECVYMYEWSTAAFEALLCGCPVVCIPNDASLPEPYRWVMDGKGIAWALDEEEIAHAKATVHEARDAYLQEEETFWRQLQTFVDKTQARADELDAQAVAAGAAGRETAAPRKRIAVVTAEPAAHARASVRFAQPFARLEREWELSFPVTQAGLDAHALQRADLIVLQGDTPGLLSPAALEQLFALGKPVVHEIDAPLDALLAGAPGAADNARRNTNIRYAAQRAHALVVPSADLARQYRQVNASVHVLPTDIDVERLYRAAPGVRDHVSLAVSGAGLDGPRLEQARLALAELRRRYPGKLRVSFVGPALPAGWDGDPDVTLIASPAPYDAYADQLKRAGLDLALVAAPLALRDDDPPREWLEYSAAGAATVLVAAPATALVAAPAEGSAIVHGRTGWLVADTADAWVDAIAHLIEHPQARAQLAAAAQDAIRARHDVGRNAARHGALYARLLEQNRTPAPVAASADAAPRRKRLVVYSVEPPEGASARIRLVQPFDRLRDEWELVWGIRDGRIDSSVLADADAILLQRMTPGVLTDEGLRAIFSLKKPVIYETDDLLTDLPAAHPLAAQGAMARAGIEFTLRNAAAVIVSTPFAASRYRMENPRVHVLPDSVDFVRFYRPVATRSDDCVTIGIAGAALRADNFALVDAALQAICARHPGKVKVCFAGPGTPAGWAAHPAATFEPALNDYDAYAQRLKEQRWDIALLPLADDDYHAGKSTIRWQEYAAAGIAAIVSDRPAYRFALNDGCDGLLVADAREAWIDALDRLIANPALRRGLARTAQAKVRKHHALQQALPRHGQVYRQCVDKGAVGSPPARQDAQIPGALILDAEGDLDKVRQSLQAVAARPEQDLLAVVLTTSQAPLPEWTDKVRYLHAAAHDYTATVEQLCALPAFDWTLIVEAGGGEAAQARAGAEAVIA
ncbi:glycosyl transferase [Burkholderia ubonensis]|uniref:glycosyltransferase family protein n=1 Tax=Burkholderia ubonensis TaxID=101571 RepID=UPI0008FE3B29|nr:glycosyltransferase [Burkholderia ubonensis]OJA37669.1 glycosyl transferase [Burkholderia ubonensis]OJB31595.1 glycosyl transferase [Burkholderia ubonensis]